MNKKSNKFASIVIAGTLALSTNCSPAKADAGMIIGPIIGSGIQLLGQFIGPLVSFGLSFVNDKINNATDEKDRNLNGGFRPVKTIIKKLKKIMNNNIKRPIYGQELAKTQLFDVLSNIAVKVHKAGSGKVSHRDLTGNIVYIRGNSGTGKTEMCREIARAFLQTPSCSSLFIHSEEITQDAELGTQLFKLISTADIGKKRPINYFTGNNGVVPKNEESPMLKHILKWVDNVVIIDEYDKMKKKTSKVTGSTITINGMTIPKNTVSNMTKTSTESNANDTSADEVFRSIASTGKYKFMNKEVDCSRTLFLITTNETREDIEKNFGVGGQAGGGSQRLNIIDFDDLTYEACSHIADDLVTSIVKDMKDPEEPYGLLDLVISSESKQKMAQYIFDDKVMQGRAKFSLESKIYGLFSKTIGLDVGKSYELSFVYDKENHDGYFEKKDITKDVCEKITEEIFHTILSELKSSENKYQLDNVIILPESYKEFNQYVLSNVETIREKKFEIINDTMNLFSNSKAINKTKSYALKFDYNNSKAQNYFKLIELK